MTEIQKEEAIQKMKNPYLVFYFVVKAIFIRELTIRTNNNRILYISLALEPLVPIMFFAVLHASMTSTLLSSQEYIVFLFSGFLIFNTFKNIALKGYDSIESNSGLFIYKQVKPIDALFARCLTEFFVFLISFCLFVFIGGLFELPIIPDDIFQVLSGFALLFFMGISFSIFISSFTLKYKFVKKVANFIFMPSLFLSAIFYSVKNMPYEWQPIIAYNPIALIMEHIHNGWFHKISIIEINYLYILFWILAPLAIGLFNYIFSKKNF